jgi:DNA modification methylase
VTPYYADDLVTIYHGDALAVMDTLSTGSVDLILTDPPYSSGGSFEAQKNTKAQGLRSATVQSDDFEWFAADNMTTGGLVWLLRAVLIRARRVLHPNRAALVFTDWRMVPHVAPALESSGLRYRNMLVWDKRSPGLGIGFKPAHEIILEYANGTTEYQALDGQNVLRIPRVHASDKDHNAQKPVPLLSELIRVCTPGGGLVVDPFMGSGSTLYAAKRSSRRAIGIEIEERYCEIAARRCSQEVLGLTA